MTRLSILHAGQPAIVVADIYLLDPLPDHNRGGEVRFEVLEADAENLKTLAGTFRLLYVSELEAPFRGQIRSLRSCVSTHPGLTMLRDRPTLCGVLAIADETGGLH